MGIKSGQKIQVLSYKDRLELIPLKPIEDLRGIFVGLDSNVAREDDRL